MKKYRITLDGYDDQTNVKIELTKTEFELIERLSKLTEEASTYEMMPILYIEETEESE